jgi:hypothetical protein
MSATLESLLSEIVTLEQSMREKLIAGGDVNDDVKRLKSLKERFDRAQFVLNENKNVLKD